MPTPPEQDLDYLYSLSLRDLQRHLSQDADILEASGSSIELYTTRGQELLVQRLRSACAALRILNALAHVSGSYECPQCGFVETRSILAVNQGQVFADLNSEPCPNDGSYMRPLRWKDRAQAAEKAWEELLDKALVLEEKVQELQKKQGG